ncbi:MAG: carbohydrate kinase family protein [Chloroflexota bacterium]
MPPPDVVVAGHVCVDLVPSWGMDRPAAPGMIVEMGPLTVRVGGCVANTGLTLAALGARVHLDADVGDDLLGDVVSAQLSASERIDAHLRRHAGVATSYSIVADLPGGDRAIWHHPGANDRFDGLSTRVAGARLVHVGYPPLLPRLALDGGRLLRTFLDRVRAAGATTSVDLATPDPGGPSGSVDWRAFLGVVLPAIDILCPSVRDLAVALGRSGARARDVRRMGDELLAGGSAVVALTDGPRGMYLRTGSVDRLREAGAALGILAGTWADQELWFASLADHAVTTTGAGDAASAGLLDGVLSGSNPLDAGRAAMLAAARVVLDAGQASWSDVRAMRTTEMARPVGRGWREIGDGVYEPAMA